MKSPVGTALVHPRRKAGQAKLGRGTPSVVLKREDLESLRHLRLSEASTQLGLSATTVKKICRSLGIFKWKHTSFREHCDDGHGSSLEKKSSDFNGVPAPLSVADGIYIDRAAAHAKLEPASSRVVRMSSLDERRAFAPLGPLDSSSSQHKPTHSHTEQGWWTPKPEAAAAAAQQRSSVATPPIMMSEMSIEAEMCLEISDSSGMESDDDFVSLA
ncbi:hypothetical protein T484DRAFT_1852334, partial [Baffinella frigidus]